MPGKVLVRVRPRRRRKALTKTQKNQVKRLIHSEQEIKYKLYSNNTTATTTPFLTSLPFDIAQGDTDQERDGDQLRWIGKIHFRYGIETADVLNTVRIIIFQWHPSSTNAPIPDPTQILAPGPSGSADIYSHYQHDSRQEYRILFDKTHVVIGNASADTNPATTTSYIYRRYRISLRKARKKSQFTAGTVFGTNKFFLMYLSDSSASPNPAFAYSSKVFFTDS